VASSPRFQVEGLTGGPAAEHSLTLVLTPETPPGIHSGSLIFTLDDPDQGTLTVDVMALLK
jgi:hypothetical protein